MTRPLVGEALGTAFLVAAVVGSGIMGERLAAGNTAVALLANAIATGGALVALIATFQPVSGAHFNPVVTLADALLNRTGWKRAAAYIPAQLAGALLGVAVANAMFGEPLICASRHARAGAMQMLSEFVATFGLLAVIFGVSRSRPAMTPLAVAAYVTGAYWFTSSTSFANPAVTLARAATDTFSGIRPADVSGFIAAQVAASVAAAVLLRWLFAWRPNSES